MVKQASQQKQSVIVMHQVLVLPLGLGLGINFHLSGNILRGLMIRNLLNASNVEENIKPAATPQI